MALARYQFTVTDGNGDVQSGATVTVRREIPGAPLVPLFSDRAGTTSLGNPILSDSDGFVFFHCVGGAYQITATKGAFSRTWRYVAIGTAAERDISIVGAGGITFPLTFSTMTADADPGDGRIALNQAVQNIATVAYVDLLDADLADIAAVLDSLDDIGSFAHRGQFRLTKYDNAAQWLDVNIAGLVTAAAGYRKLAISIIGSSSASPFADGDRLIFSFAAAGPAGQAGLKFTFNGAPDSPPTDPGAGKFFFNNVTFMSATALHISETDGNGNALASLLSNFDNGASANKSLVVATKQDGSAYFSFWITGVLTDAGAYDTFPITPIQTAGAIANNDVFNLIFVPVGDKGAAGDAGLLFSFNSTPDSPPTDPGAGKFFFNNVTFMSATALHISETDGHGNAVASLLSNFDNGASANKSLVVATKQDGSAYFSFWITAALTDAGAYDTFPITPIQTAGAIANNDVFNFLFIPVGDVPTLGKLSIWMPASAMVPRTTNPPSAGTLEMTTNKNMVKTLDFDPTTQEFAQFDIRMPKSWNEGTVSFIPVWSHAATATNFGVVWGLDAVAVSDDDALDVAFGTAQTSTKTGGTTNDIYQGPESAAITIAGTPAAGDLVMFRIHRDPADAADTMAIDARLHGVLVLYTNDAWNDT
jgi:hypothetical protein